MHRKLSLSNGLYIYHIPRYDRDSVTRLKGAHHDASDVESIIAGVVDSILAR